MSKKTLIIPACLALGALILFGVGAATHAAVASKLPATVQSVLTPYIQIHDALAKDSLDGVSAAATALGKAAQSDKIFPSEFAVQAQALAQAKDLVTARAAFKPLSETLIKVLGDNNITSNTYVEAYCPMANAHWLQTGTTISNPFGASMATCGSFVGNKTAAFMSGGCCN